MPYEIVPLSAHEQYFSDETVASLRELGAVLKPIYLRLQKAGYVIKDGKIYKNNEDVIEA